MPKSKPSGGSKGRSKSKASPATAPTKAAPAASARRKTATRTETQPPGSGASAPAPAPVPAKSSAPSRSTPGKGARAAAAGAASVPAATAKAPAKAASIPETPAPSILLEGDSNRSIPAGGPGDRYVLGPGPGTESPGEARAELPSAYGTRRVLLVARDPHWLYAHWDFTEEQLQEANRSSTDGHLVLRIHVESAGDRPLLEQHVHPESRNWFLHVPHAGTRYVAELGYFDRNGAWQRLAVSTPTVTPSDELSPETWVRFETLPVEVPMPTLLSLVKEAIAENVPLLEAVQRLRAEGHPDLPLPEAAVAPAWTPEQEQALARIVSMDEVRRVWIGSLEITELVRRQLARGISSGELPVSSFESAPGISSVSSPSGAAAPSERGFWFNVNAELIVYGATDPHATVRIGERTIRLRGDGTFSYRFALPDGDYTLPIRATSPDEVETRVAELAFRRTTSFHGEVGTHPQDAALQTPSPEHVA